MAAWFWTIRGTTDLIKIKGEYNQDQCVEFIIWKQLSTEIIGRLLWKVFGDRHYNKQQIDNIYENCETAKNKAGIGHWFEEQVLSRATPSLLFMIFGVFCFGEIF